MSVTVVSFGRARPGQADRLADGIERYMEEQTPWTKARRRGWLFRAVDDPALLLYVAEWDSREAFVARTLIQGTERSLQPLVTQYEILFFHPLLSDRAGPRSRRSGAISCLLVAASPETGPAVLALLKDWAAPRLQSVRGLLQRSLYQDEDQVDRFLLMLTWDSLDALEEALRGVRPETDDRLRPYGVRPVRFIGRMALEVPTSRRANVGHQPADPAGDQ
jgi:heme-degrading monooxygenase HmoA